MNTEVADKVLALAAYIRQKEPLILHHTSLLVAADIVLSEQDPPAQDELELQYGTFGDAP